MNYLTIYANIELMYVDLQHNCQNNLKKSLPGYCACPIIRRSVRNQFSESQLTCKEHFFVHLKKMPHKIKNLWVEFDESYDGSHTLLYEIRYSG